MHESLLLGVAAVFVLGLGAQWIAWRFRLPSILLLLAFGFVAGPVTGLLAPDQLQGDWVFTFVAVSVGIILFEGGLSLRLDELREVKSAVRNLITIGVAITGVLAGLGAYDLLGFNAALSVIIGAILTVTGPTVVIPLLRHVRPAGRVGTVAKWEGITIDPIGASLVVFSQRDSNPSPQAGDRLVLLLGPVEEDDHRFEEEGSPILASEDPGTPSEELPPTERVWAAGDGTETEPAPPPQTGHD